MSRHIDIIATTISGSIKDWGKVGRIVDLFKEFSFECNDRYDPFGKSALTDSACDAMPV